MSSGVLVHRAGEITHTKDEVVHYVVDHKELLEVIFDAYECQLPLFIWGRTGIGKSQTVKQAAKHLSRIFKREFSERIRDADSEHFLYIDRRLTTLDPTDLRGVLYKDNGVSKWYYPDWLYKLSKDYEDEAGVEIRAILHLDELNLAPPLVQNASYQLVLDRRIDELELADGVLVIASGNTAEDKAYTFDMPDPLRTRFIHATLKVPSAEEWIEWATEKEIDPRVIMFIKAFPTMLFDYNDSDRTFPTPRGWEFASRLMKNKDNKKAWRAVALSCGFIAGRLFKDFIELSDKFDIDEILENPQKLKELPIDKKLSVLSTIAYKFLSNPEEWVKQVLNVVVYLSNNERELAILLLKSIKNDATLPLLKKTLNRLDRDSKLSIGKLLKIVCAATL